MKKNRKTIDELIKLATTKDQILEGRGFYVIESDRFPSVNYAYKADALVIITRNNGMMSVGVDCLDGLIGELAEIRDHLKDRKMLQIVGA